MSGQTVATAREFLKKDYHGRKVMDRMAPGGGGRFAAMTKKLRGRVDDPDAVAAAIGRKKYGNARMARMAAIGKHRAALRGR